MRRLGILTIILIIVALMPGSYFIAKMVNYGAVGYISAFLLSLVIDYFLESIVNLALEQTFEEASHDVPGTSIERNAGIGFAMGYIAIVFIVATFILQLLVWTLLYFFRA